MVEKASKTPVRKRNITVPNADEPRGTATTPTQATAPTVGTQNVGNEQADPSALYEPAPTPVKNQGLTELSAQARMQGGIMPGGGPGGNAPGTGAGGAQPNSAGEGTSANTLGTVATGTGATDKQTPEITATNEGEAGGVQGNASQNTTATPSGEAEGTGAGGHTDIYNQIKADFEKDQNAVLEKMGARAEVDPEAKANLAKEEASKASKEKYGADWTKGFTRAALRDSDLTLAEAKVQYEQYRNEHPEAPKLDWVDYFISNKDYDPNKSLKENEEDKKKEENDRKWEDIQNALFSFADLYHGVKWAPQPTNAETTEQLTKRQEERRDKVKAMRDNDWRMLQAMWKQQQADDNAKRNLANAEAKAQADQDYKRQMLDIKVKEAAAKGDLNALKAQLDEAKLEGMRAKNEADKKLWQAKYDQIQAQIKYTNERSRGGSSGRGGGKPTYETDTQTVVTTDATTGAKTTTKTEHKYIATSRNNQKKQAKTPPSRRK